MPQWIFYAEMIYNDRKIEKEYSTVFTEYLASFWNPEAVAKIQEIRKSKEKHTFDNDEEFEKNVVAGKYKENKLLDAVKKLKSLENNNNSNNVRGPKSKGTLKLDEILSTMEKFK